MNDTSKAKRAVEKDVGLADQLIDGAREKLTDFTDDFKTQGSRLVKKASDRAEEAWEEVENEGKSAWKDVQKLVYKHPGPAVGCAVVVGAILYALFSRKED